MSQNKSKRNGQSVSGKRSRSALARLASMALETLEGRTLMSVVPHITLKTGPTPLASPSSLTAIAQSPQSIALTWTDNAQTATGYNILRSSNGGSFVSITTLSNGSSKSYTDNSAKTGQVYQYEVIATNQTQASPHSNVALVMTPLIAPSSLTATAQIGGGVTLNWTDNDSNATGYEVLRSSNGSAYYPQAKLTNAQAASFVDATADSGFKYYYEIVAIRNSFVSAPSNSANATIAIAAPTGLTVATSNGGTTLSWTGNDKYANAYQILRSLDGNTFTPLAKQIAADATTYTDTRAKTGVLYYYEVVAMQNATPSAASNTVQNVLPLIAPINLKLSVNQNASIGLTWTDADSSATSYDIQRSTDGGATWTDLATVSGASAHTYTDSTASTGATYTYAVKGINALTASAFSTPASVIDQSANAAVTITTRFGNELVITAKGLTDSVSLSESNGLVNITADGQTYTAPIPAAGIFVYTRGGTDTISIASTDATRTTVVSVDSAATTISSAASNVNAWIDSSDVLTGTAIVHKIATFAGNVTKALGASLADPKDIGQTTTENLSLFGTGPVESDVNQGAAGDCYFLSSLAAFAHTNPGVITGSAVDMGDGTYTVQFMKGTTPVFVRVNSDVSAGYTYAKPGANNTVWAVIMEKAFAYFRTGANTYASTNSGWMGEVYSDLGQNNNGFAIGTSDSALYASLSTDLTNGKAVTFGTPSSPPDLIGGHAYTLVGVTTDSNGVHHYQVRNPWGVHGGKAEDANGYATLTFAQMQANFADGCAAV